MLFIKHGLAMHGLTKEGYEDARLFLEFGEMDDSVHRQAIQVTRSRHVLVTVHLVLSADFILSVGSGSV